MYICEINKNKYICILIINIYIILNYIDWDMNYYNNLVLNNYKCLFGALILIGNALAFENCIHKSSALEISMCPFKQNEKYFVTASLISFE